MERLGTQHIVNGLLLATALALCSGCARGPIDADAGRTSEQITRTVSELQRVQRW